MANLTFNGKRLLFPGGGILDYTQEIDPNVLESWVNGSPSFDTFISNEDVITSAIEVAATDARCDTNEFYVEAYGFVPPQIASVQFSMKYTMTVGTQLILYLSNGQNVSVNYTGPGEKTFQTGLGAISSGNYYMYLRAFTGEVNFSVSEASITVINGIPA